jgi:hypothetical protein
MNALKAILKAHNKVITKLETLATKNDTTVESNDRYIKQLQEQNLELVAEAQAARNIASNFRKLIEEETN